MSRSSIFRYRDFFFLLITGFIVFADYTGCYAGSYKQPTAFFSGGGESVLYGLSKEALAGHFAFAEPGSLRYVFEPPLAVPPDSSLEVGYGLRLSGGDTAIIQENVDTHYQVVLEIIPVSLSPGTWELPLDAAFLGMPGFTASFRYALPVDASPLKELRLSLLVRDGGKGAVLEPDRRLKSGKPVFELSSLRLVPRWFGFDREGGALLVTPFVFVLPDYSPVIDPPAAFRLSVPAGISFRGAFGETYISAGERRFSFTPGPVSADLVIPPAVLGTGFYPVTAYANGGGGLPGTAFMVEGAAVLTSSEAQSLVRDPVPLDPGIILVYPREAWREDRYEVFRWPAFPRVLIFDTADYKVQERFFKRLAFFIEKRDFRGRLVPDWELEGLHGWNAHDYRAEDLARFFEAARQEDFPLLEEERELLEILLHDGIVIRSPSGEIQSGKGAVLSISRESPEYLRHRFMVHEGFHGIFFMDEEFREFSLRRWENLDNDAKRFFRSYLDSQRYDLADAYLLVNEFMAYCLQQPVSQAGRYFGENLPRQIDASPWRRSVLRPPEESSTGERSWPGLARSFIREAEAFSAYVSRRWGLAAGRVSSVTAE
jgi:hypothetical protein